MLKAAAHMMDLSLMVSNELFCFPQALASQHSMFSLSLSLEA
jgi:hypothetical protein